MSLSNILLPRPEERILELEAHLNTAIDFVKSRGLLMELPEQLKSYVLSRDQNSAQTFAAQLSRQIEKDCELDHTGENASGGQTTDECAVLTTHFLPRVAELARLPGSERLVFDAVLQLWEYAIGDLDTAAYSEGSGEYVRAYEKLDDALVAAILELRKSELMRDLDLVGSIREMQNERQERADCGIGGYCQRSLQLLKEIHAAPILRMKTRRALARSRLPPEIVRYVEDTSLESRDVPLEDDLEAMWSTLRPSYANS